MHLYRFSVLGLLLAAPLALTAGPCDRDASECTALPAGQLTAFLERQGAPPVSRFRGTVASVSPADPDGFSRITVRLEGAGDSSAVIKFQAGDEHAPVTVGALYDFQVEMIGGMPPASGLVVSDGSGIVFAGATDQTIGGHVLREGLAGFEFRLDLTSCPSREKTSCYDAVYNSRLTVTRSGQSISLWNGQSGRLDGYRVTCLTAQKIEYASRCADAGLPALSWVMSREDSTGAQ